MEKVLFISDLDGTLLNNKGELSEYTKDMLNSMISGGIYFTFATARTIYSAKPITDGLKINVPCILNNGASVYDMQTGGYVKNAYFKQSTAEKVLSAFRAGGAHCSVFRFENDVLVTCYDKKADAPMQKYADERKRRFNKPMRECEDLADEINDRIIYINAMGRYDDLLPVSKAVAEIDGADFTFYNDTYTDSWFLETFSSEASKANGIKFLREKYGFTKVIAFGDNLNDLSMFREADTKIAVGNAKPELKEKADLIIDTNDNNGVADWIDRKVNNKMSYKNIYGTDEYIRYIDKYMTIFDEKHLTEINSYILSDEFSLQIREYEDNRENIMFAANKCALIETSSQKIIYEYNEFNCHVIPITKIIHHSSGHRYYPFHVDLYGISYLDIDTMEVYNYIPEGYPHLYRAPMGESFIITDVFYDKKSDLIAYNGCYWAAPSDVMAGDFSNPLNFNPHLVSLHDILDPDYELYDDIDFKEWKNGRLYVICDCKEEKSLSAEELKDIINKLTDKGEK